MPCSLLAVRGTKVNELGMAPTFLELVKQAKS